MKLKQPVDPDVFVDFGDRYDLDIHTDILTAHARIEEAVDLQLIALRKKYVGRFCKVAHSEGTQQIQDVVYRWNQFHVQLVDDHRVFHVSWVKAVE